MQKFYIYKLFIFSLSLSFSHIFSEDFDSFRIFFWAEDLSLKSLQLTNFTGCILRSANLSLSSCDSSSFRNANLYNVRAIKTTFRKAKFYKANLEKGNFTEADFTNAIMLKTKLNDAEFFKANFENARGLTNEQKEYLREKGAVNVPRDLTAEEFEEETKRIEEELKSPLLDWIDNIIDRIFCCRKKHKKHTE